MGKDSLAEKIKIIHFHLYSLDLTISPSVSSSSSCLSATSSSRLNLTEFLLTAISSLNLNHAVVSIMPISVSTYDEENDLRFIAILNELGTISIIDPIKCCKVIEFNSTNPLDKYIQMTYCYGIDKICSISESGKIFMISTRIYPIVSQATLDEMTSVSCLSEGSLAAKNLLTDSSSDLNQTNTINSLHSLITYDQTKVNFSAKFPINWSPILSEQHQHLKHPQHIHSESINYTKHWKNMTPITSSACNPKKSFDDLTIEIYLNKPIQIGCIQIKLKFNKELTATTGPFELTLTRPAASTTPNSTVDSQVDFNLAKNTTTRTDEILFGPIDVREFLDVSSAKTYTITICSPKLYETRRNLFLLNFKAKINCLQKIQITIRKYKRTGVVVNENIERMRMLTSIDFFNNLLNTLNFTHLQDTHFHLKLLDLLNWIIYNNFATDSSHFASLKEAFNKYLDKFLLTFYLYGDRSTSRKATMLLSFLLSKQNDSNRAFNELVLEKCLSLLNFLSEFISSSALNWYFMIMHQVMTSSNWDRAYESCIKMLNVLSKGQKYNPFYALLKMRYNYSCLVFESKLFDVDLYLKFDLLNQKTFPNGSNGATSNIHQQQQQHHHHHHQQQQSHHHQQQQQQSINQFQPQFMQNSSMLNNISFSFGTVGLSANQNHQQQSSNFGLNQAGVHAWVIANIYLKLD